MYQVSNALKAALSSQLLHIRICTEAGTELDHDTLTYTASCASGTDIAIGSVCAAMIRCKLYGAYDLQDAPITVEVGAEVDGAIQYVPLGRFYVTSQERAEDSTTITGYDAAYYALGVDYAPGFDYAPRVPSPVTVADVLEDITTQCGIDLATLPSGAAETVVDGDLTGHTCREMVGYMAALVGGNAVISREGKLRLIWYTDNGQSITPDDYYSGGLSLAGEITLAGVRMTKTVTVRTTGTDGTVTEVEQTTNYDAGSGTGTVIAVDNPFATQDIVDAVWAKIGGLGTFRAGSCSAFGGFLAEPGDLISVTGLSGLTSILPAMTVQLELDGGCRCTITASGQGQTEADAQILGPTGKALKKIEADIARFKELYADNAEIERAKIEKLIAGEITLKSVLHSTDYVRTGTYANTGMGIEFNTRRFATPNFAIDPSGNIYARGGKIAGFKLKQGTAYSTAVQALTVPETGGTVTFKPDMTASFSGESFPLSKLWVRPEMAAADVPEESVLSAKIVYADSGGDALYVSTFSALIYHDVNAGDMMGTLFTLNATYLSACDHVELVITLDAGAKCSVQRQYGAWQALYTGSADTLMGDPNGIYLGTDGISVGEDIALTPDGHATVGALTVQNNIGVAGHVAATGSLVAGLNVVISNDGSVYIRDVNNVARRMLTITSANAATVGHSALPLSVYGSGITLNNDTTVAGHVTATGSLVTGQNVVIPNDGSVYIRDVNNVARRMLTITSANAATVGHSALPLSVYGSGITLAGATTISGNLSSTGTISAGNIIQAAFGVVAGNNYGFYVKNASGSLIKLFWLTSGNVCTVGSDSYATSILGKTITASKTITVSSDRRLKRDITVLDGRHQALFDRLRPVSYRLREDEDGKEHIGLVAQEVQEALEQSGLTNSALVQADSEGMLSIGYGELIGLLIDEVQTLKARVKALEERGEI